MEDFDIGWKAHYELYEDVSKFDNSMFLVNPIRAWKLAEFISYFSEYTGLRTKIFRASKESSFWAIADAFENAHSKDYKKLWESNLIKRKNDFLDELEKNKDIEFSKNEIEEVKQALEKTFWTNNQVTSTKKTIKEHFLKLIW